MAKKETERLVTVEIKMDQLKCNMERIEDKLDKFIDSADNKYATKEELCNLKENLNTSTQGYENWLKPANLAALGMFIIAVIMFVSTKF